MYKQNNKNNIFHKIIVTLIILLIILITYIVVSTQIYKTKAINTYKQQKTIQVKANSDVENWQCKADILKDELHKQNKLIVLEGNRVIKDTYDSIKHKTEYTGKDSNVKFLVDKFNNLKTKEISIQTQYKYSFTYDLNSLDVEVIDNKLHIILSRHDIRLEPIAEISSERVLSTDYGLLTNHEFTPQETSAVMNLTMLHTVNNLNSDNDLFATALMNTKTDIQELANKLGIKDIVFDVMDTETVENDDITVVSNNVE